MYFSTNFFLAGFWAARFTLHYWRPACQPGYRCINLYALMWTSNEYINDRNWNISWLLPVQLLSSSFEERQFFVMRERERCGRWRLSFFLECLRQLCHIEFSNEFCRHSKHKKPLEIQIISTICDDSNGFCFKVLHLRKRYSLSAHWKNLHLLFFALTLQVSMIVRHSKKWFLVCSTANIVEIVVSLSYDCLYSGLFKI